MYALHFVISIRVIRGVKDMGLVQRRKSTFQRKCFIKETNIQKLLLRLAFPDTRSIGVRGVFITYISLYIARTWHKNIITDFDNKKRKMEQFFYKQFSKQLGT